jgi:hypothetical protein
MTFRKKNLLYICFIFLFLNNSNAQQDAYFFIGGDLGVPISKYLDNKNTLTNRYFNNHSALNFSAQYRFWNRLGLEAGFGQHFEYLAFNDNNFAKRNPGFTSDITSKNAYLNSFFSLTYFQPINQALRLYLLGGYSLNWVTGATEASKTSYYIAGKESVTLKNSYFNNTSLYGEIGFEGTLSNEDVLSIGLKYNIGLSNMASGNYTVTKNATTIEQDNVSSLGTYIGLTIKYGFHFYHKENISEHEADLYPKDTPIKKKTTEKVHQPKDDKIPKVVDGRLVDLTKKITLKKNEVIIKVWDHEVVDGDIISLNFNGVWILQNFTLEKKAKEIKITLQPGTNYIVLHAHNLGKYSPNTAALIFDDGVKENKVILKSTLDASGTIQIDLK